jgi:threonine dehydratase
VTVADPMLVAAMRFFLERMKIVVEPTGCLAAASVLEGVYPCAGKRVGVILSGGNIDLQSLRGFLS